MGFGAMVRNELKTYAPMNDDMHSDVQRLSTALIVKSSKKNPPQNDEDALQFVAQALLVLEFTHRHLLLFNFVSMGFCLNG